MPAMYPERLRELREQNPGLQYDFRGNVIGATPPDSVQMAADAIYQLPGMQPNAWDFGPTRNDYLNSKDFVGPMPQQWWDPNGELAQQGLGALVAGRDLQPRRTFRPRNPYAPDRSASPDMQPRALHAGAADILADAAENNWGVNAFTFRPSYDYSQYGTTFPLEYDDGSGEGPERPYSDYSRYEAYGAPFPLQYDDGSGEGPARPAPPYQKYEAYGAPYPYDHDDGSGEYTPGV